MKNVTESEEDKPGLIRKGVELVAYPLTAVVGGLVAHLSMRTSIYDRLKKYGAFEDLVTTHRQDLEKLVDHKLNGNVVPDLQAINKKYKVQINERMRGKGFKNTIDYWKGIHDTERLEAGLTGFTAAGITLGVMLTLANSKSLLSALTSKHKAQENKDQTPSL